MHIVEHALTHEILKLRNRHLLILCLVLLVIIISETSILFKAKIIEGTTPPAPKIKTFLPIISNWRFLIALASVCESHVIVSILKDQSLWSLFYQR